MKKKFCEDLLNFVVISLQFANCMGQLKSCTSLLDGEKVVTIGASGNELTFTLHTPTRDSPLPDCQNGEMFLFFKQTEMQLMSTTNDLPGQQLTTIPDRYFTKDGMFGLKDGNETHYYYPEDFCIAIRQNRNTSYRRTLGIRICKTECGGTTPCLKKCCPMDQAFDLQSRDCGPTKLAWSPVLYSDETITKFRKDNKFRPHYIYHVLQCPDLEGEDQNIEAWYGQNIFDENLTKRTKFKLTEDGRIVFIGQRRKWSTYTGDFCIDAMQSFSDNRTATGSEDEQIVFVCPDNNEEHMPRLKALLYSGIMYFASIFLLLTCLYYIIFWAEQNIHGWIVFSLVCCMFFMDFFLGTSNILRYMSNASKSTFRKNVFCVVVGILAHFSFLSTFTWLSFVNIDLFLTFRTVPATGKKSGELSRYIVYAIVSWGIPIIVVTIGLILNHVYPDDESLVPVPDYGRDVCFIIPSAQGIYLYYIVSCLLGINLVFVTATFYSFYNTIKDTVNIRSNKSVSQKCQSNKLVIVTKLVILTGVTWTLEVISWALTKEGKDQSWYWYISDVYNLLQAVFIFKIFVCKKATAVRLQQKYPSCQKIFGLIMRKNPEKDPFVKIYKPIS